MSSLTQELFNYEYDNTYFEFHEMQLKHLQN